MKHIFLLFAILSTFTFARDDIEDLPDFTPQLSVRSLYSGDVLVSRGSKNPTLNWVIKPIELPELAKSDFFERTLGLGYVQFHHPQNDNICLGIDDTGFFMDKDCKKDIEEKKWESVFSILPTNTGAVQIRSLVLKKNECISIFHNPKLPKGRDFGIKPCEIGPLVLIDLKRLLILAPPFGASFINP